MHEFARVSRRVEDLQRVAQQLYPVYMQPVRDGKVDRNDGQALYAAFAPQFKEAVAAFTSGVATASIAKQRPKTRCGQLSSGISLNMSYAETHLVSQQLDTVALCGT